MGCCKANEAQKDLELDKKIEGTGEDIKDIENPENIENTEGKDFPGLNKDLEDDPNKETTIGVNLNDAVEEEGMKKKKVLRSKKKKKGAKTEGDEEAAEDQKEEPKETTTKKKGKKKSKKGEEKEENGEKEVKKKSKKGAKKDEEKPAGDSYDNSALELINKIRENPAGFVQDVEQAIEHITESSGKLIYAGNVKVALKEGKSAFDEAIEVLKSTEPLPPLTLNPDICIPVPDEEEKAKSSNELKDLVTKYKENGQKIETYFKDSVKDFYTSVLLLIIDDSGKNKGKKRGAVLSKKFTQIGITSKKVGKTFAAYYTFAK